MKNLKNKIKLKYIIAGGIVAIIGIILFAIYSYNEHMEYIKNTNPELARAMTYEEVAEGDEEVEGTNNCVQFDAFFLRDLNGDGYAESIRGTSKEIGSEDTLYMELNVQTAGSLKNAKITVNGENFYLQTALPKDDELKDNYIGNNIKEIEFNDLANGTQKMITGIVRSGDYSYSSSKANAIGNNINNYSKVNNVTLTGTYVAEDGTETPITKTVDFNIDWYGTTRASIHTTSQNKNIEDALDEENGVVNLNFTVNTQETDQELLLSKNHVEGEIPQLNGYNPTSVEYTGSNAVFNYNAETRTFTLERTAEVDEEGNVTTSLSRSNSYGIRVIYPIEAYQSLGTETIEMKIPVNTYYEGYNNPNEEFTNPYKSNTAKATIVLTYEEAQETVSVSRFDVTVGKYVYNPTGRYIVSKQKPLKIYNGTSEEEKDDTYTVLWRAYIGTGENLPGIIMKETKTEEAQVTDQFIKTDSTEESVDDVISNIGIYFSGADNVLGEEGWIKVYDEETGNLLVTFTADDWNKYTSGNPYKYEIPVKHIRVETSAVINDESYFYAYNIKEIYDDKVTEKYTKEQFDELQYIKSTLVGYVGETYVNTDTHQAHYEAPISVADIGISNNTISTQTTEKNEKLTITARKDNSSNQVGWVDGSFIVKLPEEILTAEINNVEINNSNVSITSYELAEENGVKLIKINTKNTNSTPQTYSITVDLNITPDPRMATANRNIELYASNEEASDYYYNNQDIYDVNNNLNTEELVNYDTASISMVSPNSLLTNQTASNYDDKGSTVVSPQVADIKPIYAVVDQEAEEQTATIGVQIRNNYASTISEIEILGKIPYEGNTYVLSGGELGSTFTTKMTNAGITVPAELQEYVTIYYSENENPDKDLGKAENGWKTADQVENWDNIKTYLIDFGNYVMPTGKEFVFNYTVKIPKGLEFNQVSYSHHGVYFCLDTDQGKYRTQTEPNRIGLRIAEKYNLELTKYQTGKDKLIPGATYSITEITTNEEGEEERGESKTGVTNAEGKITIVNLYAEKEYEIKEIKTPDDYELNSNIIRFIGHVDEKGNLSIERTEGFIKGDMTVTKEEGEEYKVSVNVEDEVKASIKIIKKEEGTDTLIRGARFKLTGYGLSENGRTLTTNINGELTFKGISVNQEYTLQETKVEGYYLASPIKFKIVNNSGNYSIEVLEGENGIISAQSTEEVDCIPTINVTIEDEKIPTYDLQLIKIKKTTESTVSDDELIAQAETALADTEVEYLAGAKFRVYKGTEKIGEYITDETGKVTITGLYQYERDKNIDQTYTLKEVLAPVGYAKVKDITFKAEVVDGKLVLKEINEYGEETDSTRYATEGNTIKLTIEDSPSFKLIKKDAETQEVLAGVKFAIYNVEEGEVPATNSKGEIIGTQEIINGREYYTVTTNENGELTADLPEGLYKAVEVEAPEKYDLEGQEYYFGIGASREVPTTYIPTFATSVGGSGDEEICSVASTSDGGYIAGGYFASSSIQVGEYTLENSGNEDGMLIKYDAEGEVEWARSVGERGDDRIKSLASTRDGGYIAGGYFSGSSIQVGDYTLENHGGYDGMIIKYDEEGEVEWARSVGGSNYDYINSVASTSDGGVIAGGYSSSRIQIGEYTLTSSGSYDGMIIKYDEEGEVEWARSVGGEESEKITSVAVTSDGGAIVGGDFYSNSIQVGEYTLTNNSSSIYRADGMIIKYSREGEVEWTKNIGGEGNEEITSVAETNDGDYIVVGNFYSYEIQLGDYTLEIAKQSFNSDGMIIKYDRSGEVKWAGSVGGIDNEEITSVATTSDGGYIIGAYSKSNDIQARDYSITNYYDVAVMIIKYDFSNKVEWVKSAGGEGSTHYNGRITSVDATSNGGYIVGGYFVGKEIQVGDYTLTNNNSSTNFSDGMIIKFEEKELINVDITKAEGIGGSATDEITSVTATSDGGYIAGGYFSNYDIQVGEYTLTNSSNYASDGMIIKYDADGKVKWARSVGGNMYDYIESVAETSDGGYIAGGYFDSDEIQVGDYTLTNSGSNDGMLIKYSREGNVEWVRSVGGSALDEITSVTSTNDGGYIAGGYFFSSSIQVGEYTLENSGNADGMIIKYDADGKVEWARSIGGSSNDYIKSVAETSDGGVIVGGYFDSDEIQVGEYTLNGSNDGMIIKYSGEGAVEWARSVGENDEEYITSVAVTNDGGVIVGGYFYSDEIQVGEYTLTNSSEYYADGMIIKYSAKGEVEWARSVGGSNTDCINSVASTRDGGYIAGGYFASRSIQLGDYTLTNNGSNDGMIIKYSSEGEVEWARSVGGDGDDNIYSIVETSDEGVIAGGYFTSSTIEEGRFNLANKGRRDALLLKLQPNAGVPEIQELTVENPRKEFKITTDVQEIENVKGGTISGEDANPYETVKYGDSSTKEIVMTPDENYEIIGITVNGEEYPFEEEADGTYTMLRFTNMTEDKHIEVTYALKDNKLTINKIDNKTQEALQGATFKLDQIEERTEPENVIGNIVANGEIYTEADTTNEITDVQGELTNNGTYYFVQNKDGTLIPTNGKTYQIANGGTAGIGNTTANSYVEIDLSGLEGQYIAVVNANVSSQSSNDYGYATITQTTSAPSYSSSTGRIFRISGTSTSSTTPTDYESEVLEGGNIYYLHLGYRKSSSTDTGDDQLVVNSIKVYGTNSSTYNFAENSEGGYESNNQGKDSTIANSYIPIDLSSCTGKYNLTVNANVSSQSSDYGYATVTNSTTAPAYNNTTGRFIYIAGTDEEDTTSTDYTTVLQGGQMYYLHLGYYKDSSTSSGEDKFTVNSVEVTLNDSELYHTEVITNSEGQGIVQLPFGKYQITEIEAPDGYQLLDAPVEIEFRADGDNHEITISNMESAKVIVHHYLKTNAGEYTTTKVADDELLEGKIDETYTTLPHLDLEKYELEKDTEGNYVIPANATGTYESGIIEVIYYYEEKDIPLTVHHYIEGTETPVPLKDGSVAQDITASGKEGEEYKTEAISNDKLDSRYELITIPENAEGKYSGEEVIVTYYYRIARRAVTLIKTNIDGEYLKGAVFKIINPENNEVVQAITNNEGRAEVNLLCGDYVIQEIRAPEGYKLNKGSIEVTIERDKENIITIQDEKINYYNFELSKVDSETGELLSGAEFKLTYTNQYGEERIKNLITDTSGKIILQNLEDEIVYTLEETESPIGYIEDTEEIQFVVHYANGKYEIQVLKGNLNYLTVENNIIKANIENKPSLKIVKQDQNGIPIQGVKFTITDEEGSEVVDGNNNLVGKVEEINGEQLRVVTTNENGEIAENLLAGKYIITEVQAPEGYEMQENEAERSQEIEIKASQVINISKDEELDFNNALDNLNFMFGSIQINNISAYNNGTAIYGVLFNDLTIPKEYTANEEDIVLERGEGIEGGADGIIVYINYAGKVEDIKQIKSPKDTLNYLMIGSANKNGETIAIGLYMNSITIPREQTENQEELTISNPEANTEVPGIYLITYNSNGKVSDLRDITYMLELIMNEPSMRTVSDKYILEGMPASDTFTVPAEETVDGQEITVNIIDGNPIMLVLNSEGKVISAQEEKYMETDKYNVETEMLLTTGGMIVGGYANSNVIFTAEETENGQELNLNNTANDGFIVKYNTEGKVSWANKIESENGYCGFNSIQEVSNGYIGIAYYYNDLKIQTVSGEELRFENENEVRVLIKFNGQGQIQWAKDIANDMSVVPEVIPIINEVQDGYVLLDYNGTGNSIFYKETDLSTIPIEQVEITITNTKLNTLNIPVSKIWEDDSDKLGKRPTRVVFKLTGSDGSEHTLELAKPGTAGSTTTQDSTNPNKWNDIFENLPRFDQSGNKITYTLTEEEKTEGDLKYYDTSIDTESNTVTNTSKYGKVTVHYYIMTPDGTTTTNKVPDTTGTEIPDVIIEGKEGDPYSTEEASNVSEKYELVEDATVGETEGTIEKYNEKEPQEVIYYYRLKPAKVIIHYLEKDGDADDSNNQVLATNEQIDGHVDDSYNTDTEHKKDTIEKDGRTYTLVSDSGNKTGTMTVEDINVTYYYLQNTKATVRYVARDPETHEIIKDLETPYTEEGLVGDEFVTHSKDFLGYKLVESPEKTTIKMTKEEQTLIYYYEPVYTGLLENHIDDKTGKILYTETHDVQVGDNYKIPSKNFAGYDLVESKLPNNAEGTMGEELITVNYYYIKKAVLEVNYIDRETGKPLADQIIDDTKHEGDSYTTEEKTFNEYDMVQLEGDKEGTMIVETDEEGNITNNKTVVTYYYAKKSAGLEEHHIDIRTGEELEEPTLHEGHIGDDYNIPSKEFLSYVVATTDKDGNNVLPTNSTGKMTAEKIVVTYYYNQPAKVIVHYVDKTTGKELEETNPETGELQNSQVVIEGFNQDEYETTAKEFEYYTLIESPAEPNGTMKVEIVKDENGNDVVNNTIDVYYYYEPKPFNIGVEKEITGIIVNGERRAVTNGKLEKVEIYRKSTESTSVQVEYKIKVSNTGEVRGNATIEENIPAGMSLANNDGTWEEQEGKLIKVIPEIGAGETKEYTVLLNWKQTGENMGEKANEVKLVETGNVPGFKDNNDKDNISNANVIISVETGELPIGLLIALVGLVALETVTLRYAVVLTKKQKKK